METSRRTHSVNVCIAEWIRAFETDRQHNKHSAGSGREKTFSFAILMRFQPPISNETLNDSTENLWEMLMR